MKLLDSKKRVLTNKKVRIVELIADFYGCIDVLNNKEFLLNLCIKATNKVNATIINQLTHSYNPIGISIILLLAESHIYIATWPEYEYATVNIFLCNPNMNPNEVLQVFCDNLKPKRIITKKVPHFLGK